MGRHLEFEKSEVLESALHVFWRRGFSDTSMQDLADACSINKASIYNTWQNKENFFFAVIDHYCEAMTRKWASRLGEGESGRAAIENYFAAQVDFLLHDGRNMGCLLTNTAGELGATSPAVVERLRDIFFGVGENFATAIERGKADGSIQSREDSHSLAMTLQTVLQGIRLLARAGGPTDEQLHDVVRISLVCLDHCEERAAAR
ncbi:MAG: TetR/AcrR family transcriptional regulator [Hyphomicrobiales bacterium]